MSLSNEKSTFLRLMFSEKAKEAKMQKTKTLRTKFFESALVAILEVLSQTELL